MSGKKSNAVTLTSFMQAAKEVAGLAEPEPKKKKKKRSKPKPNSSPTHSAPAKPSGSDSAPKTVKKKSSKKPTVEQDQVRERAPEPKPSRDNDHPHKNRSRKHKSGNRSRHRNRHEPRQRALDNDVDDDDDDDDDDNNDNNNDDDDAHDEDNVVQDADQSTTPAPEGYPSGATAPDKVPDDQIQAPVGYPTSNNVEDHGLEVDARLGDRYTEQPGPVVQNPTIEYSNSESDAPSDNDKTGRRKRHHRRNDKSHHTESGGEGGASEDINEKKKRKSSKRRGKHDKRNRRDRHQQQYRNPRPSTEFEDNENDGFTRYPSGGSLRPHPDLPIPSVPVPLEEPVKFLTEHGRAYIISQQENMLREQDELMRRELEEEEALRYEEDHRRRHRHRSRSRHRHREHRHHRDRAIHNNLEHFEPHDHTNRRRSHSRPRGDKHERRRSRRSHHEDQRDHAVHTKDEGPPIVDEIEKNVEYEGTRGILRNSSQRSAGSGAGSGVLGKIKSAASGLKAAVKDATGVEEEKEDGGEGRSKHPGKPGSRRSHTSQKSQESEDEFNPKPDIDDGSDGTAPSGGEQYPHEEEKQERKRRKSKDRPRRKHSKKDTKKHGGRQNQHRKKYADRRDSRHEEIGEPPRLLNEDESILAEERALTRRRSRKHQQHHRALPLDEDGSAAEEERATSRHRSKHHDRHGQDAETLDSLSSRRAREVMRGADASPAVTMNVLERFLPARSIPELKKARERAEEEGFLELPEMGENESLAEDALVREAKTSAFRVQVPQNFSYIVERWSKYRRRIDAGWHILLPFIDRVSFVHSLKEEPMTIPPHQSFTRDSVPVHTAGMLFVKVTDPVAASYAVENPYRSLLLLAQACVTQSVGKRLLRDAITERPELGKSIVDEINDQARTWGLWVSRVELTELEPPPETRAMLQFEGEAHMQTGLQHQASLRNDYDREADEETHDELAAIYKAHNTASRVDETISQGSGWRDSRGSGGLSQRAGRKDGGDTSSRAARESRGGDVSVGSGWRGSRADETRSQSSVARAPTNKSESETTYDPFLDDAVSEHAVLGASWFTGATAARRATGPASETGPETKDADVAASAPPLSTGAWEGLPPSRYEAGSANIGALPK